MFASVFTLEWEDDPFSLDLSQQFRSQLRARQAVLEQTYRVPFSVGDYHRPNPPEAALVEELLGELPRVDRRPLLVLPASLRPARRFLRTLAAAAPLEVRRLVVLTGDSISFNNIYRDRDIAWHVQDIPVPLVLFCHENPVLHLEERGGANGLTPHNSTDELLLNAVITRIVVTACFKNTDPSGVRRPAAGANELSANLRACRLTEAGVPFFDAAGNRRGGSGEHVVCLLPHRLGGRVLPAATLEVWTRQANNGRPEWRSVQSLHLSYTEHPAEGGPADAEP